MGSEDDSIGTIKSLRDGFVAPGRISSGLQESAVVWLSSDGLEWHPLDVPADRTLNATAVTALDDVVLVALIGTTGPAVARLENAAELIR